MFHYDFIIIGSGPAGRRAAIQAAKFDKRVLIVEKGQRVGGVSVHTGTIPSKTLRETALNLSGWRERQFYGHGYRVKRDITVADLKKRLDLTLDREVQVLEHQFLRNKVDTLMGTARFIGPNAVEVKQQSGEISQYSADKFLIAVGTRPWRPDNIPFDGRTIIDSDEVLNIGRLPRSVTVIGAGVIGIEYATIFNALDVKVTLIEPRKSILEFIDSQIVHEFMHHLHDRGLTLHLGCEVANIRHDADKRCVAELSDGRFVRSDMVLYAAGRVGAVDSLNLSACGLEAAERGRLEVDEQTFQTKVPQIYAAGDIVGFPKLASTSMEQGRIAACHALGKPAQEPPKYFPYGIYAVPEISTVGMSEQEVAERNIPYECGTALFRETSRGQILGITSGMMKLIFSLKSRRLLGVHIVGEGATELVHIGQAVLNLKGTIDYFVENTFNYPTLAEAYKVAALDAWNRMQAHDQTDLQVSDLRKVLKASGMASSKEQGLGEKAPKAPKAPKAAKKA